MQKAARAMYIVGIVIAIIMIVVGIVFTIVGPIQIAAGVIEDSKEKVAAGGVNLGRGIWFIVSDIIALIFTIIGYKAFERLDRGYAPYVLAIVGGVIGTAFSIVAGILSIIYVSQLNNPNNTNNATNTSNEDNHDDVIEAEIVDEKK